MIRSAAVATILAATAVYGAPIDYVRQVKPILAKRCYACHGAWKQNGGMRLDTGRELRLGGESGPLIVPGNSEASLLVHVLTGSAGFRMPPESEGTALSAKEIATISQWIAEGATSPADEQPAADPRTFWSYRPVQLPPVPIAADRASWSRGPIDAFLAVRHAEYGLTPQPEASRALLLRRVSLDLIGIPPTPEELHEFAADDRPDALHRAVDRLLASPLYGQRWGRHWMDVWRYSDWYGSRKINEIRYSQRHIWRWRDWIVDSLNADHGYDRMLIEMIAGDEAAPGDPAVICATGFLGRNWYKFDRNVWMFETVEQTCQAFLGLTMRCARCHDHKFDPITQQDYYRMRAFFEPHDVRTDPISPKLDTEKDATLGTVLKEGVAYVYDKQLDVPTYLFARGDSRAPQTDHPLQPGLPAAFGGAEVSIRAVPLPVEVVAPYLREEVLAGRLKSATEAVVAAERRLEDARSAELPDPLAVARAAAQWDAVRLELLALEDRIAADRAKVASSANSEELAHAAAKSERAAAVARAEYELAEAEQAVLAAKASPIADQEAHKKAVASADSKLVSAKKAVDTAIANRAKSDSNYTRLGEIYPAKSTGRRLALAHWLANPANPRTARIAVNQMWLRHFGEAIVPSVANFGLNGRSPSHPELLDWLAGELTAGGWHMKKLHRNMVTSAAYRMTSTEGADDSPNLVRDRENRWWWRMNSRRAESELIRDSVLYVAGELDLTFGGEEIPESEGLTSRRRSLYFRSTPNEKMTFLELFDQANPNECYRRQESVVPQQSLALFNSSLSLAMARKLADQVAQEYPVAGPDADLERFIQVAYERVLARLPQPAELVACRRFLERHARLIESTPRGAFPAANPELRSGAAHPMERAAENLVHVLLNHNDFVTVR